MTKASAASYPENSLLASVPAAERQRLLADMDEVTLARGDTVFRPTETMSHVYFPRTGVLSLVVDMEDGRTVEVGTVGREGFAGIPLLNRADRSPTRVYCQVPPCVCRRMRSSVFTEAVQRPGAFRDVVHRYAQTCLNLAFQSIACNSLHLIEERLARWLLMTHDRVGSDELNLTQQILSEMLGVRRSSVTTAAGTLQKAGLIEYHRGQITILDRRGLEGAACECYEVVRREFDRLLG